MTTTKPKEQSKRKTSGRRTYAQSKGMLALLAPTAFFVVVLFLAALAILLEYSFRSVQFGEEDTRGTLETWREFFGSSYRWSVAWTTIRIASISTFITVIIAVPTAYGLQMLKSQTWRNIGMFVIFAPLMTSVVVRVYGWSLLLGEQGLIGKALALVGLGEIPLLYAEPAVIIALVHIFLPFAVFPIRTSLGQVDWALRDAAMDLGATRLKAFLHVTLPIIVPGIIAGTQIVFALSLSSFVTPAALGGGRVAVLATEVYDDLNNVQWPMAAVSSFVLVALAIVSLALFNMLQNMARKGEVNEGVVATPLVRKPNGGIIVWLGFVYVFVLAPLFIIIVSSFSSAADGSWPPPGFSLTWYQRLIGYPGLVDALTLSLGIATVSTAISVFVGTLGAIGFDRYRRNRMVSALSTEAMAPMVVPKVTLGLAAFLLFHQLNVLDGTLGIILMHVVITLPFVYILVGAALARVDKNLESAAGDLGANSWQAFRAGTLPAIRPSMAASALFVFIISFDDLDMTIFMIEPGRQTLPIWMFIYMQKFQDPMLSALATLLIVGSLVLAVLGAVLLNLGGAPKGRSQVAKNRGPAPETV